MRISHNLQAMNVQRQLGIARAKKAKAMEKLSSGYRINRAADDAAGLAISEKMRSQIRGLDQGAKNVQDGISLCQVADGALNEIHGIIQRMYELTIQACNETYVDEDREKIDGEVQNLKNEINDIASDTEFNKTKLWGKKYEEITHTSIITEKEIFCALKWSKTDYYSRINDTNKEAVTIGTVINIVSNDKGIAFRWQGVNGKIYQTNEMTWEELTPGKHKMQISDYMDYSKYPEAVGINAIFDFEIDDRSTIEDLKKIFSKTITLETITRAPVEAIALSNDGTKIDEITVEADFSYYPLIVAGRKMIPYDSGFITTTKIINPASAGVDDKNDFYFEFDVPGIGMFKSTDDKLFAKSVYIGKYNSSMNDLTGKNIWWTVSGNTKKAIEYKITPSMDGIKEAILNNQHSLWDNSDGGTIIFEFQLATNTPYTQPNGIKRDSMGFITISIDIDKSKANSADEMVDYIRSVLNSLSDIQFYSTPSENNCYMVSAKC